MVGDQWRPHCLWRAELRQGYLSRPSDGLSIRVRLSESLEALDAVKAVAAPAEAWLTLKAPPPSEPRLQGGALARQEFEYPIPPEDAEALLALSDQQLIKTRFGLDLPGGDWVLDVFAGANAPLVVAEVELEDAAARPPVPAWCVRELTGRRELSNASLASHPLQHWSPSERRELFGP